MLGQAVRERDFSLLGEVILDLSADGLMLRTRARALTGDAVLVSFFEPRSARWYDFDATVARVIHGRRTSDPERAIGLEFGALDPRARAHLRAVLRSVRKPEVSSRRFLASVKPRRPCVASAA